MKKIFNRLLENKKIKKALFFGGIALAIVLFVVLIVIRIKINQYNAPLYIPDSTTPPNEVQQILIPQYNKVSTKSWENGAIFGSVNKANISELHFVTDFNGAATGEWKFDGLQCFVDEAMIVYVVVGDGVRVEGNMVGAFSNLQSIKKITGLRYIDTSKITNMNDMFNGNVLLTELDAEWLKTDSLITAENMFADCQNLNEINLSAMNFSNLINTNGMFKNTYSLQKLHLSPMYNVKSMVSMFEGAGLSTGDGLEFLGELTFGNCINATAMFKKSNVKIDCLEQLNPISLKIAANMFEDASFTQIDLSKWDTSKIEDASYMFSNNIFLNDINISNWDMSSLKNAEGMFYNTYNIQNINIDWTNIKVIQNASKMFKNCSRLSQLTITAFNDIKIGNAKEMFCSCNKLATINCNGFTVDVGDDMFLDCLLLPNYESSKIDGNMANNSSGYFTKQ